MQFGRRLQLALCCLTLVIGVAPIYAAAEPVQLELPGGQQLEVTRFGSDGGLSFLWIPSERGFTPAHQQHASALAARGHQVWLVNLHGSYFVQPGRASIGQFPLDDLVALIDAVLARSSGELLLVSSSRGAQLALVAAREWQLRNPGKSSISGIVLTHAHLYGARPEPGKAAQYLPIVHATNLPVYLLAAQYSTKSSRLQELADALHAGGSTVYTQLLAGVQGGFVTREAEEGSAADAAANQDYANTLSRAASLLRQVRTPRLAVVSDQDTRRVGRSSHSEPVLAPLDPVLPAPVLVLGDLDGGSFNLDDYRGQVVLVNFWASWCRPCVAEIPSLHRLDASLEGEDFRIVTVNVGEEAARVERFLQQVQVELPVLMDYDASISKGWMIYVYPSSYLVDRQGNVRYAYLGALEWDSTENLKIIRQLLSQR